MRRGDQGHQGAVDVLYLVSGGEHITDAGLGDDVSGVVGIILQLLAQVADIRPQIFPFFLIFAAPDAGEQVPVQHHPAGVTHQMIEQLVFSGGEADFPALYRNPVLHEINRDIITGERPGTSSIFSGTGAAQDGFNPGEQLLDIEGLGQVVVGSQLQAFHFIRIFHLGGEHNDGYRGKLPDAAAKLVAIDPG